MSGVAVGQKDSAGGIQLTQANTWYKIEGCSVVVIGDAVAPHAPAPPHTTSPVMVEGSDWYKVNSVGVCRAGDLASCGHATTGRSWYRVI